jgi:hypothetical protein
VLEVSSAQHTSLMCLPGLIALHKQKNLSNILVSYSIAQRTLVEHNHLLEALFQRLAQRGRYETRVRGVVDAAECP